MQDRKTPAATSSLPPPTRYVCAAPRARPAVGRSTRPFVGFASNTHRRGQRDLVIVPLGSDSLPILTAHVTCASTPDHRTRMPRRAGHASADSLHQSAQSKRPCGLTKSAAIASAPEMS
eukprot:4594173-Prymnesium_polylepis.1